MYNVLFNRIMQVLKMRRIRNNFYNPKEAHTIDHLKYSIKKFLFTGLLPINIFSRLEIWPGYVTHIVREDGGNGLFLQCDVSHKVHNYTSLKNMP